MSMTKQDRLDELESLAVVKGDELRKISVQIRKLKDDLWLERNGVSFGDKVSFIDGREVKIGTLKRLVHYSSWVYPIIILDKNDGTPGIREARCYDEKTIKKIV